MKSIFKISILFLIITSISSCSSIKVVNSWENSSLDNLDQKKVIVFNYSEDDFARIQLESEISNKLDKRNINAIESYKIFKKIDTSKEISQLEISKYKDELRNLGIEIIVITLLNDTEEYTKTAFDNNISMHHNIRYFHRYRRFYHTMHNDFEPSGSITYTGKIYTLETAIYDISKEDDKQLISILTTEVINPKTLGSVSKGLSKKITRQLLKK